eukprot:CAMPEP_0173337870 /NCGR_PEP_ID=MMETSP1144-20121109/7430_1 /TAXON_ID=483371 /ORGANISM="non described non described, Strain CCMP2298" /LENGTH=76 /DNA_ID=CAMNT_0014283477 /DNA_START=569 /DNA_END=796 /DNA_ORIENTATION=-
MMYLDRSGDRDTPPQSREGQAHMGSGRGSSPPPSAHPLSTSATRSVPVSAPYADGRGRSGGSGGSGGSGDGIDNNR